MIIPKMVIRLSVVTHNRLKGRSLSCVVATRLFSIVKVSMARVTEMYIRMPETS